MFKIITPGHRVYRKTCYYCQCIFTFEEEDVKKEEICDRGVSYGFEEWIKCPYCERRLDVDKTDIYVDKKEG